MAISSIRLRDLPQTVPLQLSFSQGYTLRDAFLMPPRENSPCSLATSLPQLSLTLSVLPTCPKWHPTRLLSSLIQNARCLSVLFIFTHFHYLSLPSSAIHHLPPPSASTSASFSDYPLLTTTYHCLLCLLFSFNTSLSFSHLLHEEPPPSDQAAQAGTHVAGTAEGSDEASRGAQPGGLLARNSFRAGHAGQVRRDISLASAEWWAREPACWPHDEQMLAAAAVIVAR